MTQITINYTGREAENVKRSLQKLADHVTPENLMFLAELSSRPGINKKLENNKFTIKAFL